MDDDRTVPPMGHAIEGTIEPSMPFPPGTLIAGKYRIERLIGEGGMGSVVLARHVQLDQLVAVKFMHRWQADDAVTWFLREARAAARIQSEFVARVSDTGMLGDGTPYMVMEYLEGEDLEALLKRGRLPVFLVATYAMQAAEGLAEAHALGIVHRDLKPSNLFLARRSDGSSRVKLLDFGVSKSLYGPGDSMESPDASNPFFGTPRYMAPEQLRSASDVDRRADIWSLGAVIYEMLAGVTPFGGGTNAEVCARVLNDPPEPLSVLRADIPATLEAAVMQCLEKDPQHRFRTAAALARALAASGSAGARKTADRIARIAPRYELAGEDGTPQTGNAAIVPYVSLTDTSFGRALEGIERIVHGPDGEVDDAVIVESEPSPVARVESVRPSVPRPESVRPPITGFSSVPTPGSFRPPAPGMALAHTPTPAASFDPVPPPSPWFGAKPKSAPDFAPVPAPGEPYRPVPSPAASFESVRPPPASRATQPSFHFADPPAAPRKGRRAVPVMPLLVVGAALAVGAAIAGVGTFRSSAASDGEHPLNAPVAEDPLATITPPTPPTPRWEPSARAASVAAIPAEPSSPATIPTSIPAIEPVASSRPALPSSAPTGAAAKARTQDDAPATPSLKVPLIPSAGARPKPPPAASTSASTSVVAPIGTTGFGGRD